MESWRGFVNEETQTLTEQEINELLQEIGRMKNFLAKLRGAPEQTSDITGKGYGRGWEAALEKFDDEDAAKAAQQLKIPNVKSVEDLEARIKALEDRAEASGDPKVQQAAQELTNTIAQTEPPSDGADQAVTPVDVEEVPDEENPEASGGLELDRSLLMKIVKNPDAKVGPAMVFRTRLTKYLQSVGLPRSINRMSPVVKGILNIVRQAALAANPSLGSTNLPAMGGDAGSPSLSANLEERIEKAFVPIILEEIKREKTRRILIEIAQKVAK
jgi:hypothetical protein